MMTAMFISGCASPRVSLFPGYREPLQEFVLEGEARDKVLVIQIKGFISTTARKEGLRVTPSLVQEVVSRLRLAERDRDIKAVVLQINSPGGTATASDILYHEIMEYKKRTGVKVVAAMMDLAASGGYYVSLPADFIMAHPTTVTGSIGVIFRRPLIEGFMNKLGLEMEINKSGENKDMASSFRRDSAEERQIIQDMTDALAQRFTDLVLKHRRIGKMALVDVETARIYLAGEALKMGLIDQIGYMSDALLKAKRLAGLPDGARVVVYRRSQNPNDNIYSTSASRSERAPLSIIDLGLPDSSSYLEAGFYYLWSPLTGKN